MPSSLSSLLADKLGLSEDHAHRLLERLAHTIREHADATGVHVSGLGTFRDQDGTLTFEPADTLARQVNHRFEGLDAEPAASAPGDLSDRLLTPLVTGTRPDAPPDAPSLQAPEDPLSIPPVVWSPHSTAQETPTGASASSLTDESGPSSESDTDSPRRPTRPDRDRSAGPRIAAAILAALFLVGAGWLVLGQQGLVPPPQSVLSEQAETPSTAGPDETSRAAGPPADTADANPDTTTTATASDDTTAASDAPAHDQRWTLVVASRDTRTAAKEQADMFRVRLSDLSLPINIRTAETNNTTRHRVAVGDFSSREAALDAMDEHQSLLPEGVWLLRHE